MKKYLIFGLVLLSGCATREYVRQETAKNYWRSIKDIEDEFKKIKLDLDSKIEYLQDYERQENEFYDMSSCIRSRYAYLRMRGVEEFIGFKANVFEEVDNNKIYPCPQTDVMFWKDAKPVWAPSRHKEEGSNVPKKD